MKEHPILFTTPMVQAILNGNKTMTRRVIKPQPGEHKDDDGYIATLLKRCPYGQPGDRLFVKETWKVDSVDDSRCRMLIDFKAIKNVHSATEIEVQFTPERYRQFRKFYQKNGWQSPYFIPKEATRIWLNNEVVRVERVQEIAEADALKEGCKTGYFHAGDGKFEDVSEYEWTAQDEFYTLWQTINAKRGYDWEVNPWCWVVEFKVISEGGGAIE